MKKYYILRADGSSIFENGYPLDFIYSCYYRLLDRFEDEEFRVMHFANVLPAVQADRGTGDASPVLALLEPFQK